MESWNVGRQPRAAAKINSYRDLLVWQKGMLLAKMTYKLTSCFPDSEHFGLVSQMRRAAVAVPSNIAEGQARQGRKEFAQFLSHAEGSLAELDTQMLLAIDLGYCSDSEGGPLSSLITELQKMTSALRARLGGLVA
jgi:four helix bundle protein